MPTLTRIECLEDQDAIGVSVEKTSWPRDSPPLTSSPGGLPHDSDVRLKATTRAPSFQGCKLLLKRMIDEDKDGYFLHPGPYLTSDLGSIQDELYNNGDEPPTPDEFCSLIRTTFESVHSSNAEVKVKEEARRLLDIFESSIALVDTPETRAKHISVRFGMTGDTYFRNQISISSRKIQNAVGAEEQNARFATEVNELKIRFKEFECKTLKNGNAVSNFHTPISSALRRKSKMDAKVDHVKGSGEEASNSDVDICMKRLTELGISNTPHSCDGSSPFTLSPFVQAFRKIEENLMAAKTGQEEVFYEHMKKFMLNRGDGYDMIGTISSVNGAVTAFEDLNNRLAQVIDQA